MITIEQCRAARGLLGWTQQDLADACGLSKTAINNFEKGHSDIKAESLKAIRMAFESAYVEFLSDQGLRKKSDGAEILKGADVLSSLVDDIVETLKNDGSGGELLIISTREDEATQQHAARLQAHNIKRRVIGAEGMPDQWGAQGSYRRVTKENFSNVKTSYIYGSKVAFQLWDPNIIIVVNSRDGQQSEKRFFESLWSEAAEIPEKESEDDAQSA